MSAVSPPPIPVALTVAGSDSGGGAGIQADLRTFAFHCVHGTSALTCITAQNTLGVERVEVLSPDMVLAQIDAVGRDIAIAATKTGMLPNADIIAALGDRLQTSPLGILVVDPVMVSRAGAKLIDDGAIAALKQYLLPLAAIATPNRYEAEILTGRDVRTIEDMKAAARQIRDLGPRAVLVKGGGLPGGDRGVDVWYDGTNLDILKTECVETPHTHGTGCTLSAAIAARLALGDDPLEATRGAKAYVTEALQHSLAIGGGQGPVGHFFPLISEQ